MPDITSTRPASGAPIATAWGAEVHDQLEGIQTGKVNVTAGSTPAQVAVVFPRPYAAPPTVFASPNGTTSVCVASARDVTAIGFNLTMMRADGVATATTQSVAWLAVGTPA